MAVRAVRRMELVDGSVRGQGNDEPFVRPRDTPERGLDAAGERDLLVRRRFGHPDEVEIGRLDPPTATELQLLREVLDPKRLYLKS